MIAITQLVDNGNGTFPFHGWEGVFGEHCWFYAAGFAEVSVGAGLADSQIKLHRGTATTAIPGDWERYFPNRGWKNLSRGQIESASARAPQRFDKAALSLLALRAALLANRDNLTPAFAPVATETDEQFLARVFWPRVSIRPAIYRLAGFDAGLWAEIEAKGETFKNALRAATPYISARLYAHLPDCRERQKVSR